MFLHAGAYSTGRDFKEDVLGDNFGVAVAGLGGNVLIGSPFAHVDGGSSPGAAYLFDGSSTALLRTYSNPNARSNDFFGFSVASAGNNVLVGANRSRNDTSQIGAAYLLDGSTAAVLRTFPNPTPANGDQFGISVAAVGNNVLVGDFTDDTGGKDAGAAYLIDSSGVVLRTFLNPSPVAGNWFGHSVAALGNNVLVGSPLRDSAYGATGAAYLFDGSTAPCSEPS